MTGEVTIYMCDCNILNSFVYLFKGPNNGLFILPGKENIKELNKMLFFLNNYYIILYFHTNTMEIGCEKGDEWVKDLPMPNNIGFTKEFWSKKIKLWLTFS